MQADAFLFATLVSAGDPVVVEKPTYDRTLLNLRSLGADVRMVSLQTDGIDTDELARAARGRRQAEARARHPELPEPGRLHAVARQARGAARPRRRARLRDLRGRPVPPHPLLGRGHPDDDRDRRRRRGRLRVVVLEDGLPGHPRRLPRRAEAAHRADPEARDEHVHLAEHGRRRRSSTSSACRARSTARSRRSRRRSPSASRCSRPRSPSTCPRPSTRRPRAATSCGSRCPRTPTSTRCSRPARSAASQFVKGSDFLLEGGHNMLRLAYSGVTPDRIDEGVARLADAYRSVSGRRRRRSPQSPHARAFETMPARDGAFST